MFSKIKDSSKRVMEKCFFISREIESFVVSEDRVLVNYKEGEPMDEEMSVQEWEAGKKDAPVTEPKDLQQSFVERTNPIRKAVLDKFAQFNPRFDEITKIMQWIEEGLKQAFHQSVSHAFDVGNFGSDSSVELFCKKIEDAGGDVNEGLDDVSKDFIALLRKHNIKIHEVINNILFGKIKAVIDNLQNKAVTIAMGVDAVHLRIEDVENILKQAYEKAMADKAKQPAEPTVDASSTVPESAPAQDSEQKQSGVESQGAQTVETTTAPSV